jgi:hypothetical protein
MPYGMEKEVREFFKRILGTIGAGLLWMVLQDIFGIMLGYAFTDNGYSWKNTVYYIFCLLSLGALIYLYYRMWRGKR